MLQRTFSLIRKELLHITRDPRTLAIMIVMPLMMLILLGYAATTDVEHLRTAVYDADKSPHSRALIAAYQNSNYFDILHYVEREADLTYLIDHGDVRGALVIPPGYGQDVVAGQRTTVAFLIDGSDPTVANSAYAASLQVGQDVSFKAIQTRAGALVDSLPGVEVRPRVWYNPNLESAHFMIQRLVCPKL
jgi:ABC-2 type transport system permease protein